MLANPFKKQDSLDDERQSLWDRLTKFSPREMADAEQVVGEANRFLEWDNMPYSAKFKEWLYEQSVQPTSITDHLTMVGQAARNQAFSEVLNHLRGLRQKANVAVGE